MARRIRGLALTALAALAACSDAGQEGAADAASTDGPLVVHAVNYPLAYFAERIGGERVDVRFLAADSGDPAFWKPGDADVAQLQQADLILLNGAKYAKWIGGVSLSESALVNTSAAFGDAYIATEDGPTHSHGDEGEHSHAGTAFTTWIDFQQARKQAEAVRDALVSRLPAAADGLRADADALLSELDALDADLAKTAEAIGDRPLLGSHPVYQYLARRYSLAIRSLHWEPDDVPDDAAMAELAELRKEHAAAWMIWEGDPAPAAQAKLESAGVGSVVFDPCGNRPAEGDWLSVMRRNIEQLGSIAR